ncbi:MAG: HNH endonuclease [Clostridia bacterium]|nr:HNH endonuclease [Clostridia bacterium]
MLIDLPNQGFEFIRNMQVNAYINKDGILKIKKQYVKFEDLMYALTYTMKRDMVCPFCGAIIRAKSLTLDHMYPRDFGGVSIPNNLIPCCRKCNSNKGSLDCSEYYRLIAKNLSRGDFEKEKQKIIDRKEKKRYTRGIFLPEEWLKYVPIDDLIVRDYYKTLDLFGSQKNKKLFSNMAYIKEYNHMKRPVIVDKNLFIVDGYVWYVSALVTKKFKKIPVVMIDNLELI